MFGSCIRDVKQHRKVFLRKSGFSEWRWPSWSITYSTTCRSGNEAIHVKWFFKIFDLWFPYCFVITSHSFLCFLFVLCLGTSVCVCVQMRFYSKWLRRHSIVRSSIYICSCIWVTMLIHMCDLEYPMTCECALSFALIKISIIFWSLFNELLLS